MRVRRDTVSTMSDVLRDLARALAAADPVETRVLIAATPPELAEDLLTVLATTAAGGSSLATELLIERLDVAEVPKGAEVQVHGHTDSIGSAAYNQELSEKRARAVAEVIESVRSDLRLQVKGFGKDRPVESNDEPAGRALNRRVEIRYSG